MDFEKVKKNYRKDTPYRGGRVWLRGYPDPNGEPWKSYLDECQGRFPMRLASATADLDSDLCGPATRVRHAPSLPPLLRGLKWARLRTPLFPNFPPGIVALPCLWRPSFPRTPPLRVQCKRLPQGG